MYKLPKKKQLDQEAIPTTSLADMMFLLLIFFIMTATLARVTGFLSEPPSGIKSQGQTDKSPTVALQNEKILVNEKDMTVEEMEKYLRGLQLDKRAGEAKVVVLSTSGAVNYQRYYRTMSMIQACGGIVAIETEDTGKKP